MDLKTFAILLGLTNLLLVIALIVQRSINRTYRGLGWWVLGFSSNTLSFMLLFFRPGITNPLVSILLTNGLLTMSGIYHYVGMTRFLGQRENRWLIGTVLGVTLLSLTFFTYILPDLTARTVIVSASVTSMAFAVTYISYKNRLASIRASLNFVSILFFAQGIFFALRAVEFLLLGPVNELFTPTLTQTMTFLVVFITGILLTFGLILMVNQRLAWDHREAGEHFKHIFHTSPDSAVITRWSDGVIVDVNEGFSEFTGYSRAEVLGHTRLEFRLWRDPEECERWTQAVREQGSCRNVESDFIRKDGSVLTGLFSAKLIELQGEPHIISITRDISKRKRYENELEHLASVDGLTGIYNRRHFEELAQAELERSIRYRHALTLALIDVDHLKTINDSSSHASGDRILKHFVEVCQGSLRSSDIFARFGGDEFVLLLPETGQEQAHEVIDRVRRQMAELPVEVDGVPVTITLSWGTAGLTGNREPLDLLLSRADKALYQAKETGRDRVVAWAAPQANELSTGR